MSKFIPCCEQSSQAKEHLYGTAPRVENWFLLEYPENWGKDIFNNNNLSVTVNNYLSELQSSFYNSRLQFIKKNNVFDGEFNFYYVKSSEFEPCLYNFKINGYEDILDINIEKLIESGEINKYKSDEKIIIVCSHGSYDSCCGKYGIKIYNEIANNHDYSCWNTTHVGSHRFSANLVILPEGIYYGRVNQNNINNILESHLKQEIFLDCYRGRSCYTQPSQVSDYFLRKKIDKLGIYDIRWEYEKDRYEYICVEFRVDSNNLTYSVNSIALNDSIKINASCGDEDFTTIPQFYFYSIVPYEPKSDDNNEVS